MTIEDYVTIQEGARISGMSRTHVRRLAIYRRVAAFKMGRDWLIEKAALLAYVEDGERLGSQKHNPWRDDLVEQGRGRRKADDAA